MTDSYTLERGTSPLLISMPHIGTELPAALKADMSEAAWQLDDTDWHIERLYGFARQLGASILQPRYSRYVIDLNRPPDDASLYPGQNTTGLCPSTTFDGVPLYRAGCVPDAAEVARRRALYWQPYHDALGAELARLRAEHGVVRLWDAHSIRSQVPRLFDGELPVFNLGTADGAACGAGLGEALLARLEARAPRQPAVLNGRFKGGYITRAYGAPRQGVHAVQLELAQRSYMEEQPPYGYDTVRAHALQPVLADLLALFLAWRPARD
jgi:N-formylglutamate deformylase